MDSKPLEVLFTPIEYETLRPANLTNTICVVFDVLRATSSMITALFHGARGILPARSVPEAVELKRLRADCLLAGERNGIRIRSDATGGVDFDLGNSPREFTPANVAGRSIVMTTTNGTRALRACHGARTTLICSFLNLLATAEYVSNLSMNSLLLICSGTGDQVAYEDVLCAGALVGLIRAGRNRPLTDAALISLRLYEFEETDLEVALARSANGQRLTALPELRDDVAFCAGRDRFPIVAGTTGDAPIAVIER
jgi:2-phosphosulfolactate phosphatase